MFEKIKDEAFECLGVCSGKFAFHSVMREGSKSVVSFKPVAALCRHHSLAAPFGFGAPNANIISGFRFRFPPNPHLTPPFPSSKDVCFVRMLCCSPSFLPSIFHLTHRRAANDKHCRQQQQRQSFSKSWMAMASWQSRQQRQRLAEFYFRCAVLILQRAKN